MRPGRIEAGEGRVAHVTSGLVAGTPPLDDLSRWTFQELLHRVAGFSGFTVLAYAVLRDRFHALVRPVQPGVVPDDAELLRRLGIAAGSPGHGHHGPRPRGLGTLAASLAAGGDEAEATRRALRARMGRIGPFLKELKQLFSLAYNRRTGRRGTLWSNRYAVTVIEDEPALLRAAMAYVDLRALAATADQPVLPGIPPDFTFTSLAEALAGGAERREAIRLLFGGEDAAVAVDAYRRYLLEGAPPALLRRCHGLDGAQAIGSPGFIASLVSTHRPLFAGPRSGRGRPFVAPWTPRETAVWPHFPERLEVLGYQRGEPRRAEG